jgi:hypothetical protein
VSGFSPAAKAEQSAACPPAQGRGIRQTGGIFAVWRGLLNRFPCGEPLTGILSTAQSVVCRWCEPLGQDREGFLAWLTDSAPHPDRFALIVVALTSAPSVTDDRGLPADGTLPRQESQRDHPGSMLSFASGSAIKRITAGVKAAADRPCQSFDLRPAFTLPAKSVPNEKKNTAFRLWPRPLTQNIGRFLCVFRPGGRR